MCASGLLPVGRLLLQNNDRSVLRSDAQHAVPAQEPCLIRKRAAVVRGGGGYCTMLSSQRINREGMRRTICGPAQGIKDDRCSTVGRIRR